MADNGMHLVCGVCGDTYSIAKFKREWGWYEFIPQGMPLELWLQAHSGEITDLDIADTHEREGAETRFTLALACSTCNFPTSI
jgi:hypothetical protein